MNDEAVYRTALATPGLLNKLLPNLNSLAQFAQETTDIKQPECER